MRNNPGQVRPGYVACHRFEMTPLMKGVAGYDNDGSPHDISFSKKKIIVTSVWPSVIIAK